MRIAIISVFGLLPSLLISYYAIFGFIIAPQNLLSGKYILGLTILIYSSASFFATYSLLRYLFGTPLRTLQPGMLAGFVVTITIVVHPFVRVLLERLGVDQVRFTEGINLAAALGFAAFCILPMSVFAYLLYRSTKLDGSGSDL